MVERESLCYCYIFINILKSQKVNRGRFGGEGVGGVEGVGRGGKGRGEGVG